MIKWIKSLFKKKSKLILIDDDNVRPADFFNMVENENVGLTLCSFCKSYSHDLDLIGDAKDNQGYCLIKKEIVNFSDSCRSFSPKFKGLKLMKSSNTFYTYDTSVNPYTAGANESGVIDGKSIKTVGEQEWSD